MKKLMLLACVVLGSTAGWAQFNMANRQRNDQTQPANKFYYGFGGGFGAGTDVNGNTYNYYSIMPLIGYRVTTQVSLGASFTYQRYNYTSPIQYSFTQYGVGP